MVEIDRGMPLPKKRHPKYPWSEMKIGDSFFVESRPDISDQRLQQKIAECVWGRKKAHGGNFTVRRVDGGVRVWRTE